MKVVEVAPIIGEEGSNGEAFGSLFFIKKNCQVIHISWLNFSKIFLLFGIKELGSSFVPFSRWATSGL
jgi:hypothetical protein